MSLIEFETGGRLITVAGLDGAVSISSRSTKLGPDDSTSIAFAAVDVDTLLLAIETVAGKELHGG